VETDDEAKLDAREHDRIEIHVPLLMSRMAPAWIASAHPS
jgi:hypothetical protein